MASAAETTGRQHQPGEFLQGDRAQEAAVVHARRADPVPPAVVRAACPGIDPRAPERAVPDAAGRRARLLQHVLRRQPVSACRIIALGVMPYITASIVVQLGADALRSRGRRSKKEGETGRKKLNQYTRYLHGAADDGPGLFHRRRPGEPGRASRAFRRWSSPGMLFRIAATDQPGRRHHVPDVDRRADHQPRHRQRRLADHHGRHRRSHAAAHRPAVRGRPDRQHWTRVVIVRHRRHASCWSCSSASWSGPSAAC